ncbi:SCO family protein [Reichenbachiella versicolor]|uniref:SCO family protein n=1 Tax=Reichenbachiella versicolor TaxID=1821036 RepID=UPI000D6E56BE|nr:SCO family protein [Reichenbachiella versicolor]
MKNSILIIIAVFSLSCSSIRKKEVLPVLGRYEVIEKTIDGKKTYDSIPHTIADFSFLNQDSMIVDNDFLKGKAYIADFFFTSCPTICPTMKKQLLRVFDKYKHEKDFAILSHTIDPKHDTIPLLKDFSERLGVTGGNWHFLYGTQEEIYSIGEKSYMLIAGEDSSAPGGYIHSGAFILVDDQKRVRGIYDGTDVDQVNILLIELDLLLNEIKSRN